MEALVVAGAGRDEPQFGEKLAPQLRAFTRAGGRVVLIGRHNLAGDTILADNVGGAQAVARTLIAQGHRMIGVIGGPPLLTTTRDRLDGFCDVRREAGLSLPPLHIVEADFTRDGGYAAALELSARAPGITAIFALNDPMAVGTLSALRERGMRVPDDISVVGFDDIPMARDTTPTLSTVHVPMVEMGSRAMELALARDAAEWRVEHFPTRLVLRRSTAIAPRLSLTG